MRKFLLSVTIVLFTTGLTVATAQESVSASGGEASGSGGSVSYSVGQLFYRIHTGTTGSVAEGVQQPYEISVITATNLLPCGIGIKSYQNYVKQM